MKTAKCQDGRKRTFVRVEFAVGRQEIADAIMHEWSPGWAQGSAEYVISLSTLSDAKIMGAVRERLYIHGSAMWTVRDHADDDIVEAVDAFVAARFSELD
jgi:hypothetical protein